MSDIEDQVDEVIPPRPRRRGARATVIAQEREESTMAVERQEEPPEPSAAEMARSAPEPDLDIESILPTMAAHKPLENVKGLGDLYAKYGIGTDPQYKVQIWRSWPKMLHGVKIDGFYDSWDQALSEEQIGAEYGGGTFKVVIMGPHPQDANVPKRYDSVEVQIAGPPKEGRLPRHQQGALSNEAAQGAQVPPLMIRETENPKLVEAAMKVVSDVAEREREERRRIETKAEGNMDRAQGSAALLVDAEKRRSDDVIRAERERHDVERQYAQERIREAQERAASDIRRIEEARATERALDGQKYEELRLRLAEMEAMNMNRPSAASDMKELLSLPQFQQKDASAAVEATAKTNERILDSVMAKHQAEMESARNQQQLLIDSLRRGHDEEKASMRESHSRAIEAERESSRGREGRIEQSLQAERDERRRDQDRAREMREAQDVSWKERLESQAINLDTQWKARLLSVETTFESRIQWLQSEIDRKLNELAELRTKIADNHDPVTQLQRMKELKDMATETFGLTSRDTPAAPAGGIGIGSGSGGGIAEMVKDMVAPITEGLGDNIPSIISALAGRGQPQPQRTPQPGDQYNDPQHGPMVVVRAPNGQLSGVPQSQYAAYMESQKQSEARPAGLLQGQQGQQRRQARPPGQAQGQQPQRPGAPTPAAPRRRRAVSTNFATSPLYGDPLARPEHWDEEQGGNAAPAAVQAAPQRQQRPPRRPPEEGSPPMNREPLGPAEKAAAGLVAKLVHQHVVAGDEPEDFVAALVKQYPRNILQQVVAKPTDMIVEAVKEAEPNGAGATPAGEAFGRRAIDLLRAAVTGG